MYLLVWSFTVCSDISVPVLKTFIAVSDVLFAGYQQYDVNARLKLKGMGKSTAVQKMTPEQAADIGADIVGELIVYSILALLVVSEYYYYARAAELKEQDRKEEWNRLARKMDDLIFTTEKQDTEIKELRRIIFDIHEKNCSLFEKLKNNRGLLEKLLSKEKKG